MGVDTSVPGAKQRGTTAVKDRYGTHRGQTWELDYHQESGWGHWTWRGGESNGGIHDTLTYDEAKALAIDACDFEAERLITESGTERTLNDDGSVDHRVAFGDVVERDFEFTQEYFACVHIFTDKVPLLLVKDSVSEVMFEGEDIPALMDAIQRCYRAALAEKVEVES